MVAAVALVLAAGCSSGDEAATTTSTTAAPTTAVPATSSTAPPTTTTTEPPTTTIDEIAAAEEAAVAAVLGEDQAWIECTADPQTCDPEATFLRYMTGEVAELTLRVFEQWKERGWALRPPIDPADDVDEVIGVEVEGNPPERAVVIGCRIDGFRIVDVAAAPDGSDVVVDDDVSSILTESIVVRENDGQWRVSGSRVVSKVEGGGGCEGQTS